MQAPVALIFNVLVSSMNSMPDASEPRMKTGTWSLILGERRCCEDSTRRLFFSS
jgi:hypothetical protein